MPKTPKKFFNMMKTTAKEIEETLLSMENDKQRDVSKWFFKTGPGEYGENDHFLGIRNPQVRLVTKEAWKTTSLPEARKLVHSKWHEVRLCGLLIMDKKMEQAVKHRDDEATRTIFESYTLMHPYVNNWDLVDLSAYIIAGWWEVLHPEETLLDDWMKAGDSTLWQRRISMVSTWQLMRHDRYREVLQRASCLLSSKEDLLHKAAGWMLRELSKNGGKEELLAFLDTHVTAMPPTMLRYAIEKFPAPDRQYWLQRRRGGKNNEDTA